MITCKASYSYLVRTARLVLISIFVISSVLPKHLLVIITGKDGSVFKGSRKHESIKDAAILSIRRFLNFGTYAR